MMEIELELETPATVVELRPPDLDDTWIRAAAEHGDFTAEQIRMIVEHFRKERAEWLIKQDARGKEE